MQMSTRGVEAWWAWLSSRSPVPYPQPSGALPTVFVGFGFGRDPHGQNPVRYSWVFLGGDPCGFSVDWGNDGTLESRL